MLLEIPNDLDRYSKVVWHELSQQCVVFTEPRCCPLCLRQDVFHYQGGGCRICTRDKSYLSDRLAVACIKYAKALGEPICATEVQINKGKDRARAIEYFEARYQRAQVLFQLRSGEVYELLRLLFENNDFNYVKMRGAQWSWDHGDQILLRGETEYIRWAKSVAKQMQVHPNNIQDCPDMKIQELQRARFWASWTEAWADGMEERHEQTQYIQSRQGLC